MNELEKWKSLSIGMAACIIGFMGISLYECSYRPEPSGDLCDGVEHDAYQFLSTKDKLMVFDILESDRRQIDITYYCHPAAVGDNFTVAYYDRSLDVSYEVVDTTLELAACRLRDFLKNQN